jgi:D-alanyl-D-alanine carboxypeptidase/D-alanyl-D-alanine-endopeptidase (penicillin-binding protein 4)
MSVVRLRPVLAALAALLLLAPAAQAAQAADADATRAALTREFRAAGALSGAYARDLTSGTELIAVREDAPRIPASVEKLFVTASSLLRWGPTGQLSTRAVSAAEVEQDGTLEGDVWLVGGGDPGLDDSDLRTLARAVRTAGVRSIGGDVIADDTLFDRRRGGPRTGFAPDYDLGGRLGSLVLRRGFQPNPATYAAQRFLAQLRAAGIAVAGDVRTGAAPDGAAELATVGSAPMSDLIRQTNVPSDNFYADMLLKALGATYGGAGTTGTGAKVVRDTLDDFGVRPRIADGSGLSRANRTSPRQVVRLLERMDGQDVAATWRSSLAVPGRSGTVSRRMRGTAATRCRVKTGTIRGVSNLAGVCSTATGGGVAFAWLMQGVSTARAHRIQDRMTAALARYSAAPPASGEPTSPGPSEPAPSPAPSEPVATPAG